MNTKSFNSDPSFAIRQSSEHQQVNKNEVLHGGFILQHL